MGTKLLLGFGGTVIQVVVHQNLLKLIRCQCFGGTVIQVVAHLTVGAASVPKGFGSTAIQAVVYLLDGAHVTLLVSEEP